MTDREVVVVDSPEAVARAAAERAVACARAAVVARGRFSVALSGGSTPRALFRLLAEAPLRSEIDWARIDVFWGDERCVPPTHPDSNYRMAKEALLDQVPIPPERIHRIAADTEDHAAAATAYEAELARILGRTPGGTPPVFDFLLLGMGADGHTASLFPGTPALAEHRRWVVANRVEKLGADRITLTWPILNRAAYVLFLVAGADKAAVLREVLEGPRDVARLPAQGIRPEAGRLVWLLDRAAATQLATTSATA
ncbi:MAG: 6-phosphogluconolactonase [Candidatus Rokuibacteriota bacterium]